MQIDNTPRSSEPALRRKNYIFVGDLAVGSNLATLYAMIATCQAMGLNPFAYLLDVLRQVQAHIAKSLHELLPGTWTPITE